MARLQSGEHFSEWPSHLQGPGGYGQEFSLRRSGYSRAASRRFHSQLALHTGARHSRGGAADQVGTGSPGDVPGPGHPDAAAIGPWCPSGRPEVLHRTGLAPATGSGPGPPRGAHAPTAGRHHCRRGGRRARRPCGRLRWAYPEPGRWGRSRRLPHGVTAGGAPALPALGEVGGRFTVPTGHADAGLPAHDLVQVAIAVTRCGIHRHVPHDLGLPQGTGAHALHHSRHARLSFRTHRAAARLGCCPQHGSRLCGRR